jgi:hypothetical protein
LIVCRDVWCGAAMRLFIKKVLHRQSGLSAQRFRAMVRERHHRRM